MVQIYFSPAKMEGIGTLGILRQLTNKMSQEESVTIGPGGKYVEQTFQIHKGKGFNWLRFYYMVMEAPLLLLLFWLLWDFERGFFAFSSWKSVKTKDIFCSVRTLNNCLIQMCSYFQLAVYLKEPSLGRLTVFSTYFLYSCYTPKFLISNFMTKHKCCQLAQDIQLSCFFKNGQK